MKILIYQILTYTAILPQYWAISLYYPGYNKKHKDQRLNNRTLLKLSEKIILEKTYKEIALSGIISLR